MYDTYFRQKSESNSWDIQLIFVGAPLEFTHILYIFLSRARSTSAEGYLVSVFKLIRIPLVSFIFYQKVYSIKDPQAQEQNSIRYRLLSPSWLLVSVRRNGVIIGFKEDCGVRR